jgi:hypothetical protein
MSPRAGSASGGGSSTRRHNRYAAARSSSTGRRHASMASVSSAHSAGVARNVGSRPISAATHRAWIDAFARLRGACAGDAIRMAVSTKNANAASSMTRASNGGAGVVCPAVTAPTTGGKVAAIASYAARSAAPNTGCQRARGVSSPSTTSPGSTCFPATSSKAKRSARPSAATSGAIRISSASTVRSSASPNNAKACVGVSEAMAIVRGTRETRRASARGAFPTACGPTTVPSCTGNHAVALVGMIGAAKPSTGSVAKSVPSCGPSRPYASEPAVDAGSSEAAHTAGAASTMAA